MKVVRIATEKITGHGHPHITATNPHAIEFTKDAEIGHEAHAVVGVAADKGCADLSDGLKAAIRAGHKLEIRIRAGALEDRIVAYGHPDLTADDPKGIAIRRSGWHDNRTIAVHASKSSNQLDSELVEALQNPKQPVEMIIEFAPVNSRR